MTSTAENKSDRKLFLLADDDHDDAELFAEALEALPVSVSFLHVEDGYKVLSYLSKTQNVIPDIIFLDLNMPELNGWQCLAKLKNDIYFAHIPVIIYSTSSHPRDKEIALQLGAAGFFTKPSDFKHLTAVLGEIAQSESNNLKRILDKYS
jgi:CheY-like chemotaxis protein